MVSAPLEENEGMGQLAPCQVPVKEGISDCNRDDTEEANDMAVFLLLVLLDILIAQFFDLFIPYDLQVVQFSSI